MDKRKKSKFQRRINRIKNKMQYLRKRFAVPFICVLLCFSLISVTLFSTKQQVYATGVEEMLYYTYWDLISGLFSEVGYQYSVTDEYYTSPKRASGEQIWDNFCTWVENKAKALSLPVAVVHDELKNLPNVVTEAGVTMSEKLAEILAKVLPTVADEVNGKNQFDCSTTSSIVNSLSSICGASGLSENSPIVQSVKSGHLLNVALLGDGSYYFFTNQNGYSFLDAPCLYNQNVWGIVRWVDSSGEIVSGQQIDSFVPTTSKNSESFEFMTSYGAWAGSLRAPVTIIMKNGAFAGADGIAQSDYARVKVKEKTEDKDGVYVPGVGWKTKWEIWDDVLNNSDLTQEEKEEWWLRYHVNELLKDVPDSSHVDPDDEKRRKEDNKKDRLPIFIPIVLPHKKDDKQDTEDSTEESTEKDTEGVVVPIPTPDPTEDSSEDSTQDSTQDEDYEDVIDSSVKAGNWKRLFPFCIPWDIMTLIKSMNAEKKAPHFKYEHTFKGINYTFSIDVDMSDYWKYIKIFRWGMTIFFIIGLFFLTVKFTTFVHRGS